IASFSALDAARWDVVGFETPAASATAMRDASVTQAELDEMAAGDCTYLLAGVLTSAAGRSCPGRVCVPETEVRFRLCVPASTAFGPCNSPDGSAGLAIAAGSANVAHVTIHGDHLWFNTFPSGAESLIERRAQWLVDCDADHDGQVTQAELEATPAGA